MTSLKCMDLRRKNKPLTRFELSYGESMIIDNVSLMKFKDYYT